MASPSSQTVDAGGTAFFAASATNGNPAATSVRWLVSTDGGVTFHRLNATLLPYNTIDSFTNNTMTETLYLQNATAAMNGYKYKATFFNTAGPVTTASATLTVQYAPAVTASPTNQMVNAGGATSFTATESNGNPAAITVQWQVSTDGGNTFQNLTNSASVLLLSTGDPDRDAAIASLLTNAGWNVTVQNYTTFTGFTGTFNAVVLSDETDGGEDGDMPAAGQTALLNFVNTGGGLITLEWITGYDVLGLGDFQTLGPPSPSCPRSTLTHRRRLLIQRRRQTRPSTPASPVALPSIALMTMAARRAFSPRTRERQLISPVRSARCGRLELSRGDCHQLLHARRR